MSVRAPLVAPGRRGLGIGLYAAWLAACWTTISYASAAMYFEPTDSALAQAAKSVPRGEAASVLAALLGAAVATVRRLPALGVLVLPGALGFAAFAARSHSHGLALVVTLVSTLLAVLVSGTVFARDRAARKLLP